MEDITQAIKVVITLVTSAGALTAAMEAASLL